MNKQLLLQYVRLVVESAKEARVPNQLIDTSDADKERGIEAEDVNEFSGVGAVAGYTAPLGADPNGLGRKKNSRRNKKLSHQRKIGLNFRR